jgi:hypothetical protein
MPLSMAVQRGGRRLMLWLLPWTSVLVVSTSIAYAINSAVTGFQPTHDERQEETSVTRIAGLTEADAMTEENQKQSPGRLCASLFGSYNPWLFSNDPHGLCGLDAEATSTDGLDSAGPP